MPDTKSRFEWPAVHITSTHALVASRLFEPYLAQKLDANTSEWSNSRNWFLGYYFGRTDTRLWVPRRTKAGKPRDEVRVINFGHPLGRKALRVLLLGYLIGLTSIVLVLAALFGARW